MKEQVQALVQAAYPDSDAAEAAIHAAFATAEIVRVSFEEIPQKVGVRVLVTVTVYMPEAGNQHFDFRFVTNTAVPA